MSDVNNKRVTWKLSTITGHFEYLKCLIVSDTKKGGLRGIVTINSQFCPVDPILMIS